MDRTTFPLQRLKLISAWVMIAIPAVMFYFCVLKNAVRIPILDDYDVILGHINWISKHHGLSAKLLLLLTSEHNGYKLMFENGVVLLEYGLLGKIKFLPLVFLGDAFPIVIFLTVVAMARFDSKDAAKKWLLLVPVAWIIFQLQYASALDFASSSLQHLAVIAFALVSILLISRASAMAFAISCIALLFSIAASPNGFFVAPVGILMLAQYRRWRRLIIWCTAAALMLAIYLFRYSPLSQTGSGETSERLVHLNAIYALSFLGASAAKYSSILPSVILGLALLLVFVLAIQRRYFAQNPAVFYSMLFILINAIAVSGLRSDLGVTQSLASRYRTYSNLFLAFTYIFFIETQFSKLQKPVFRRVAVIGALIISVVFACLSDIAGARFLRGKKDALIASYRSEWQGNTTATSAYPAGSSNPALIRQIHAGVYKMDLSAFQEAVKNGIIQPPQNP